jgi:hypothetical protein
MQCQLMVNSTFRDFCKMISILVLCFVIASLKGQNPEFRIKLPFSIVYFSFLCFVFSEMFVA